MSCAYVAGTAFRFNECDAAVAAGAEAGLLRWMGIGTSGPAAKLSMRWAAAAG